MDVSQQNQSNDDPNPKGQSSFDGQFKQHALLSQRPSLALPQINGSQFWSPRDSAEKDNILGADIENLSKNEHNYKFPGHKKQSILSHRQVKGFLSPQNRTQAIDLQKAGDIHEIALIMKNHNLQRIESDLKSPEPLKMRGLKG